MKVGVIRWGEGVKCPSFNIRCSSVRFDWYTDRVEVRGWKCGFLLQCWAYSYLELFAISSGTVLHRQGGPHLNVGIDELDHCRREEEQIAILECGLIALRNV